MFFSNLLLYRLTQDASRKIGIDGESLAHALKSETNRACSQEPTASFLLGRGEECSARVHRKQRLLPVSKNILPATSS